MTAPHTYCRHRRHFLAARRPRNHNLEQQAQALYKSWFVEFEPFKDSDFVESQHGLIPVGCSIVELGQIAEISAGGDKPNIVTSKPSAGCDVPIYSNGTDNKGLYGYTNEARINVCSVTVTARGTIGDVQLRLEPYCPIVRLISVIPKEGIHAFYLYLLLRNTRIEGVGTTQQQLTVPNFKKELVLKPDNKTISSFVQKIRPLIDEITSLEKENLYLSHLRNSILPKLLTGDTIIS